MDVSQMQRLPGMPSGFPFAMILLGIVSVVFIALVGSIEGAFFRYLSIHLSGLGLELIKWGSILQGLSWICTAFARRPNGPTA